MKLFKQNNLNKKSLKLRIVLLMLISILSNYFFVLSEFSGIVLATTNDLSSFIQADNKEQENIVSEETEIIQEKEENNSTEEISEEIQNVEDEVEEEVDENAEKMNSSMEVLQSYSTSTGFVVEAKVTTNISNVKNNLELQKVILEAPIVEGYAVKEVYLNNVELNNDNLSFTSSVENNNIIIEITESEENELNQFIVYENASNADENVILNNIFKEYTVLYVLEGTADVNEIFMGIVEELKYSNDTSILSDKINGVIIKNERIENEYSVSSQNNSIYKGNLYANAISTLGYETNYSSIDNVYINSLENIDNILIYYRLV